ncbi:MAG TPA: LEA type 2 family protein [Kofleriaceae bacterium]
MVRRLVQLCLTLALAAGCHANKSPELRVVGLHEEPRHEVVFVQVTNPASHVMKLTKLEYSFAANGTKISEGEVALRREVPAGEAIVVEIPLDRPSETPLTLSGKLTAELNEIEQTFSVSARVDPSQIAPAPQGDAPESDD